MQKGNPSQMIFSIEKIIAYISSFITLKKGDYIMTGTPKGVSAVSNGDHLIGKFNGKEILDLKIKS